MSVAGGLGDGVGHSGIRVREPRRLPFLPQSRQLRIKNGAVDGLKIRQRRLWIREREEPLDLASAPCGELDAIPLLNL